MILLSGSSYAQFLTVLVVFILVLGATAAVTKWIAGYQRAQGRNGNIEVLETSRIANNKYIQIVRIGGKRVAIAVGRDEVTKLCELDADELKECGSVSATASFRELLAQAKQKSAEDGEPEEQTQQIECASTDTE